MRRALLLALLFAAAAPAHAQAGREQFRQAARTCRYAPSADQRACMAQELCRENRDPASCERRYYITMERRDIVLAACKGRQGTTLNNCMRDEYQKLPDAPRLEACAGLEGTPLRECVRDEYKKLPPPKP